MPPLMRLGASLFEGTLHGHESLVLPAVDRWREITGFYPSILPLWSPFDIDQPAPAGNAFPADWLLQGLRERGVEPAVYAHSAHVNIATHGYEAILRGERDEALERWGQAAAAYGHRLILRWDHEMNGAFAWSRLPPPTYTAVFRHVSERIRVVAGAGNVKLYFCPILRFRPAGLDEIEAYYPGDDWCHFVGFDGFSWYETWQPLAVRWGPLIDRLSQMTDRPIIVGEFGRQVGHPQRAKWLDTLRDVRGVAAVIYFDMNLTHHPPPKHRWRMGGAMRRVYRELPRRSPRLASTPPPDAQPSTETEATPLPEE